MVLPNRNIDDSGAPAVTHGWVQTPVSAETLGEAGVFFKWFYLCFWVVLLNSVNSSLYLCEQIFWNFFRWIWKIVNFIETLKSCNKFTVFLLFYSSGYFNSTKVCPTGVNLAFYRLFFFWYIYEICIKDIKCKLRIKLDN